VLEQGEGDMTGTWAFVVKPHVGLVGYTEMRAECGILVMGSSVLDVYDINDSTSPLGGRFV
jgi:hypothetical protein